jgi:hypothetical protein
MLYIILLVAVLLPPADVYDSANHIIRGTNQQRYELSKICISLLKSGNGATRLRIVLQLGNNLNPIAFSVQK